MKAFKIVVQNIVKQDVKSTCTWYDDQKKGLGKRFVVDMKQTLIAIERNPTSFAIRHKSFRLANFSIFPYAAHFFIDEESHTIFIFAVLHTKRHPDTGSNR